MNTIRRKSAIIIFAIYKIALLSNSEIEDILFSDYLDEETGEPIAYEDIYDSDIQDFLLNFHIDVVFYGISNEYLLNFLEKCFNKKFIIIGDDPELNKCPCCSYLTLPERGQYDVCPICQWEDDGRSEDSIETYSTVNHSSLKDYRLLKLGKLSKEDIFYRKG